MDLADMPGRNDTAELLLAQLVDDLDELERKDGENEWAKASTYVASFAHLAETDLFKAYSGQKLSRAINNAIKAEAAKRGKLTPRPTFLSNAKRTEETWEDIFTVGP